MEKNKKNAREIDLLAGDVASWWNKTFVYMKKTEVATWKGALVLTFITGIAVAIIWSAKTDFYDSSKAAAETALYFTPASTSVSVGDTLPLDAMVNPGTNNVQAVELHITYDQTKLSLTSIACSSVFSTALVAPTIPSPEDGTAVAYCGVPLGDYISSTSTAATFTFEAIGEATGSSVAFAATSGAAAQNETGNVVTSRTPAAITVTSEAPADTTAPTVTAFVIPSTATSLTVPITTFTASDDTAVTGYILTESASAPSASASGWSATAPANYVFTSEGSKTLYAWAKDAAGNVSSSLNDSVTITLPDSTAPTVTAFVIPSTATSLTVSISSFTASDTVGVTGYMLTETSQAPSATASGWTASAPSSYTFSTAGTKTLYAWAKDAANNVSASLNDSVTVSVVSSSDSTAPVVTVSKPTVGSKLSSSTKVVGLYVTTDETATCRYSTSASIEYASMTAFATTGGTSHDTTVAVSDGNSYNFYVKCQDAANNTSSASTLSFSVDEKKSSSSDSKKKTSTKPRTIKESPKSLARGKILKQTGKKFSKSSVVLLYFSKVGGGYYPPTRIMTTSKGAFTLSYRVTKPKGSYSWYAVDTKTGKKSKVLTYKVK